jgi:small subunit ribosomal protein S21
LKPTAERGGGWGLPKVTLRANEPVERALRRLKKKIDKEGIMKVVKRHRHYEKPSQKRRRKAQESRRK